MANAEDEKNGSDHIDSLEQVRTYIESEEIQNLPNEHREYLMQKHGTLDLDPVPDMSDADPYNWSTSKKCVNLALVAFHALMATFTAASIQSAFVNISLDLHVSLQRVSYLVSLFIAILGGAPLFWRPFSHRFGRRPIFLLSLIGSLVGNIGCANSHSYGTMGLCRAITAFFISPAAGFGSAVVAETFFKKDRARAMGVWTLLLTIGVPISPFIFGFVALRVDYRWIYYILAITNGVQCLLYAFLGRETRYVRKGVQHHGSSFKQEYFAFKRIDPTPLRLWDFVQPLTFAFKPCVMIPAAAYAMIFLFGSVLTTILIPQLYPVQFKFNTQEVGLQFIGIVIGSVLGEQVGGISSDRWMAWQRRKSSKWAPAEFRLWLSYPGFLLTICGVVVFLMQISNIKHYNVTPTVGAAIAAGGNQIVTTIMITYAVDCYREEAAGVGVFITFVRQIWGFIGPFWFPQSIEHLGYGGAAALMSGLMIAGSILPTIYLQWRGPKMR